jgi:hypothetical protein
MLTIFDKHTGWSKEPIHYATGEISDSDSTLTSNASSMTTSVGHTQHHLDQRNRAAPHKRRQGFNEHDARMPRANTTSTQTLTPGGTAVDATSTSSSHTSEPVERSELHAPLTDTTNTPRRQKAGGRRRRNQQSRSYLHRQQQRQQQQQQQDETSTTAQGEPSSSHHTQTSQESRSHPTHRTSSQQRGPSDSHTTNTHSRNQHTQSRYASSAHTSAQT